MLNLVRGDMLEFTIALPNADGYAIQKVEFASSDLAIRTDAFLDGKVYRVRIEGEKTKDFPVGFSHYDIIVTLIDNQQVTLKYQERIEVLARKSEV